VGWPRGVGCCDLNGDSPTAGMFDLPEKSGTMSAHILDQKVFFIASNICVFQKYKLPPTT
jgi:hypothetical protein